MARSTLCDVLAICLIYSVLLQTTAIAAAVTASEALGLLQRDVGSCTDSFDRCADSRLPADFCCPASSTCISLDNASSAICCPKGEDCSFIKPIVCDIQLQNVTANPENSLKTSRLGDSLPKCGTSCCPFGYTCQGGNTCALSKDTSSVPTSSSSASSISASTASSMHTTAASTSSTEGGHSTSHASSAAAVSETPSTTASAKPTTTIPDSSVSSWYATALPGVNTSSATLTPKCPSFPGKAVVAGFFPGLICGVMVTLIAMICLKRRNRNRPPPSCKLPHIRQRGSDGTIIGISDPIPSEDSSFRTDFLRRDGPSRNSVGARSMLHRSRSRVKSLFGSSPPKPNGYLMDRSAPPLPVTPPQQIRPHRQPSTESIRVFSPDVFASSGVLNPGPYPSGRPNTTFTEMIEKVGFQNSNGSPYFRVTETPQPQGHSPPRKLA